MKDRICKLGSWLLLGCCALAPSLHAEWLLEFKQDRQLLAGKPLSASNAQLEWQSANWQQAQKFAFGELARLSNPDTRMQQPGREPQLMLCSRSGSLYYAKLLGLKDKKWLLSHPALGEFSLEQPQLERFTKRQFALFGLDENFANWKAFAPGESNALPMLVNANRVLFNSPGALLYPLENSGYINLSGTLSIAENSVAGIVIGAQDTSAEWSKREFCESVRNYDQSKQANPGSLDHSDFSLGNLCRSGLVIMFEYGALRVYRIESQEGKSRLLPVNGHRLSMRFDSKYRPLQKDANNAKAVSSSTAQPVLDNEAIVDAAFDLRYNVHSGGIDLKIGNSVNHNLVLEELRGKLDNASVMFFSAQRSPVSFNLHPSYHAFNEGQKSTQGEDQRDVVELQGGKQRLLGSLQGIENGKLAFKTSYAKLALPLEQLEELQIAKAEQPALKYPQSAVRVMLDCGSQLVGELLQLDDNICKLRADGNEFTIKKQHIKTLVFASAALPETLLPGLPKDVNKQGGNEQYPPDCGVMQQQITRE